MKSIALTLLVLAYGLSIHAQTKYNYKHPVTRAVNYYLSGWQHIAAGKLKAAQSSFKKCIEQDKGQPFGYYGMARSLMFAGDTSLAFRYIDSAMIYVDHEADIVEFAGTMHLVTGDLDNAETLLLYALNLSDSVDIQASFSSIYTNLGMVYLQQGRHDIAIEYFKKTIKEEPTNRLAYYNLGVATYNNGQLGAAMYYFATAKHLGYAIPVEVNELLGKYPAAIDTTSLTTLVEQRKYYTDTLYINKKGYLTDRAHAYLYRLGKLNIEQRKLNGQCAEYFLDGSKSASLMYNDDGKLDGGFEAYHTNGQIKSVGSYMGGKKSGKWRYYYPDGKQSLEMDYDKDEPIVTTAWDSLGNVTLAEGNGYFVYYYQDFLAI